MIIDENFRILNQTKDLILGNICEKVFLIQKINNNYIFIDEFYGDPNCGIIDTDFNKCLIGGEKFVNYDVTTNTKYHVELLYDVYDLRKISKGEYEILIDPWSTSSAIWKYNLITNKLEKKSDFTKYKNLEYTEKIEW